MIGQPAPPPSLPHRVGEEGLLPRQWWGGLGEEWNLTRCTAGSLRLQCLGADLALAEVYADVPELAAAASASA